MTGSRGRAVYSAHHGARSRHPARPVRCVIYSSTRSGKSGIYRRHAGGGATTDDLLLATDDPLLPTDISADGQRLLVTRGGGPGQRIWMVSLTGEARLTEAFPGTTRAQHNAVFSPDGKWIAYVESSSPGSGEIYMQAFPADGRRERISPDGGRYVAWTGDGKSIVYRKLEGELVTVALRAEAGSYRPSTPVKLFPATKPSLYSWTFSMDPQAMRFLLIEPPGPTVETKPEPITVVVNFVQSLAGKSR